MTISIRTATPDDAILLSSLGMRTFCETFNHYHPDALAGFLDAHYSPDRFAKILQVPENIFWIAELGGEAIAYAKLGSYKLPSPPVAAPVAELHQLYVRREWKGNGIGSALMDCFLAEATRRAAKALYLGVWENNIPAQKFYTRYGFEKVGEYDYPPIGDVIDREWIMMKHPAGK